MKSVCSASIIGVFLMVSTQRVYSQSNISPPSPNASAAVRQQDIPVNHFTGVPGVTIPIFSLTEKGHQIPLSLSYQASGIKAVSYTHLTLPTIYSV